MPAANPNATGTDTKEEPKKARNRTFKLVGGPHQDEDGIHEASSPTEIVKSSEDLVAKHGSEKFVEVDSSHRAIPIAGQPETIPGVPPLTEAQMQAVADRVAANKAAKPATAPK